uniref:UBC core domain-containing protein n=1 Tax=Otolemur garnettii TaxID=30611 RepID=H0XW17_OTOGA
QVISSPGRGPMDADVVKFIKSKLEVRILGALNEFVVKFYGPQGTPREGGVWRVRDLPDKYPSKSPSIAPCDLTNVFESFLPQLLAYPNPIDPLNGDAAATCLHRPEHKQKIKEHIQKYAAEEALEERKEGTASESSMSDFSEDEAQDMEL